MSPNDLEGAQTATVSGADFGAAHEGLVASFSMRKQSCPSIMWRTTVRLLIDALRFVSRGFRSRSQLVGENLFLRKQLAL